MLEDDPSKPGPPPSQGIVSTFLSLLVASVCVQGLNVAYMIYAARVLGPEGLGAFAFIMAFTVLLAVCVTFGRGLVVTREATLSNPEEQHQLLQTACFQQGWMSVLGAGCFFLIVGLIERLAPYTWYVLLAGASLVALGPATMFEAFFRGVKRMNVSSIAQIIQTVSKVALGVIMLWAGFSMLGLFIAYFISSATWSAYLFFAYRKHSGRWLIPRPGYANRMLLKDGSQILLGNLTSGLFNRFDWILLGSLRAMDTVGIYSAAYRFYEILIRIPGHLAVSAFPALCQGEEEGSDNRGPKRLCAKLAIVPGCIAAVFALWWAEPAVNLLLGPEFGAAGLVLQILFVSLPFHGGCAVFYHIAVARRRQRFVALPSGICATLNVALCLLLIPRYGPVGAAIAMTLPSILQCILLGYLAGERAAFVPMVWFAWRVTAISLAATGVIYGAGIHWLGAAPLAGIVIAGLLWIWNGLNPEEMELIRRVWGVFVRPRAPRPPPSKT